MNEKEWAYFEDTVNELTENLEKATGIANAQGLFIDGEIVDTIETDKYLEESIMAFAIEQKERVLH